MESAGGAASIQRISGKTVMTARGNDLQGRNLCAI